MMPIHAKVEGSPEQVHAVATWLRGQLFSALRDYEDTVSSVRRVATADWDGDAAYRFTSAMSRLGHRAGAVQNATAQAAREFETFADALTTAEEGLAGVRARAATAGLQVRADTIYEPGPAPPLPARPAAGAASIAEVNAYNTAAGAYNEYVAQVRAYNSAVDETQAVMTAFERACEALRTFVYEVGTSWQSYVDTAVLSTELAFKRHVSGLRDYAENLRESARLADDAYLRAPGGSAEGRFQERLRFTASDEAAELMRRADDLSAGRMARLFGGKIPVVGAVVTVAGVGYDVHTGASPSGAIVGAAAGALATAGVVAVVGGPVGWVAAAGIVVGVGAGMLAETAWEAWAPDDVKEKIDEGIRDVWNATTSTISSGWGAVTDGVGDVWEAIF